MIPGSVGTLSKTEFSVAIQLPDDEVRPSSARSAPTWRRIRRAARRIDARARPRGRAARSTSSRRLRDWFEPLMDLADLTAAGINGLVVIDCGEPQASCSTSTRARSIAWQGEECDYYFRFDPALVE